MLKAFIFKDDIREYDVGGTFIGTLSPSVNGKEALFSELYKVLDFPGWFGFNWDALFDCLRDFEWIENRQIVLRHSEIPKLESEELGVYLEILWDSMNDWKPEEDHEFTVIFPIAAEKEIKLRIPQAFAET